MSRHYNVYQDVEGCIEKDNVDINYIVTWVKDLVTGETDIDDIKEVWVIDSNGAEDMEYYPSHHEAVRTAVYSDAYEKGVPCFDEECDVSYSQMLESFAEQERED